jgi:prevent-host-death family protein
MVRVSITELKARLSEHLRLVKGGEEVLVTERGRAVAVLGPVPLERSEDADLEALVESGLVRPARRAPVPSSKELSLARDPERAVLGALLRDRREGR